MKIWLKTTIFLAFVGLLAIPIGGRAQAFEKIISFDSRIQVSRENVVDVTETIEYDFGSQEHHGIYRYVPIRYTDDKNQTYNLALNFIEATYGDGSKVPVSDSKSNGAFVMKIGDPDKTISGVKVYKIHYELTPVVRQEGDKGFLALDITGNGWNVPIDRVSAKISLDDGRGLTEAMCFSGFQGSATSCQGLATLVAEANPTFVATNLQPNQGMTVQGFVPAGYVSNYLVPGQSAPLTRSDYAGMIVVFGWIGGLFLAGWIVFLRWWRRRRRKKAQTIIAQYEAPDGLSPAEIGLLQDDVSNMREITATLIDMAVRGYLKIEQTSPKRWYSGAKYTLHKLKTADGLNDYERQLFNAVFESVNDVKVDDLDKSKMSTTISGIHSDLKAGLKKKGFYGSFKNEPGVIEKLLDTGNISEEGAAEWAKVEGLKEYLSVAEKDRLNFSDAPAKTPERFSKLLPFAVALGVEKEWAKQFAGMDLAPATGYWYVGGIPNFSADALASDLGSGFSSQIASNSTVSSSSSGGFSGGGFGGGGGGSW